VPDASRGGCGVAMGLGSRQGVVYVEQLSMWLVVHHSTAIQDAQRGNVLDKIRRRFPWLKSM